MATFRGLVKPARTNDQGESMARIAEKDYYRDAEGNLIEGTDPKAAFLVVGKGSEISKEIMDQYGISEEAPQEPAPEPAEEKAAAPAANKSVAPAANKGAKKK
jgi:hypothetical protein